MKVLFVYKPYYEHDVKSESQQEKLRGSFFAAFGTDNPDYQMETLHFGLAPGLINTPKEMNEEILKKDFDICIVSEELTFAVEMNVIKKLGKKLFLCCWDTFIATSTDMYTNFRVMMKKPRLWGEHVWPIPISEASQYCNVIVADYGYGEMFPNVYAVCTPIDTRIYNTKNVDLRNIDVGFNGMFYIPERAKYYEIFQKANIPVTYTGSVNKNIWPAQVLDSKDFASIFKRTKISLSYTESIFGPNNRQRKGRIYEVAATGSFLLTTHPEVMKYRSKTWFDLGEHFDYMDESNCVEKVRYYLANPEKRESMANAMHEHFMKTCAPLVWWENIFQWAIDK